MVVGLDQELLTFSRLCGKMLKPPSCVTMLYSMLYILKCYIIEFYESKTCVHATLSIRAMDSQSKF